MDLKIIYLVTVSLYLCFPKYCYCERDYLITLKRFEPMLEDDTTVGWNDLRVTKINRTMSALRGTVEVKKDIDETLMIEVQGYEWYSVDYRLSGVSMQKTNLCKFAEKDTMFFQDLADSSDIEKMCPVKAGTYNVVDFYLDSQKFPEKFPGDQWRLDVMVTNPQSEVVTGVVLYLDVDHNAGIKNKE